MAWVREAWSRLAPPSTGVVYLNCLGLEKRDADRLTRASFGSNYDRLVEIKAKYDCTNFFRLNQNIKPSQVCKPQSREAKQASQSEGGSLLPHPPK